MTYAKTELGQKAFKERSPLLSTKQRSAFILFDGSKTVEQVLAVTGITQADVEHMVSNGWLAATGAAAPVEVAPAAPTVRTPEQRYADAYPVATRLTASLGLSGFKLNLDVEAARGYDDLLALLPRIQKAVGSVAAHELEQALLL